MKLVSFLATRATRSPPHFGALLPGERELLDFCAPAADLPQPREHLSWFDLDGEHLPRARALLEGALRDARRLERLRSAGAVRALDSVALLAPVPRPWKFLCIGLNYRDHALEQGAKLPERPLFFSKLATSVSAHGQAIEIPPGTGQVDYEAELGVVIGRRARRVREEDALRHVLGYTCVNDVTARDFQHADRQWLRGKSPDGFGPFGPSITTADEVSDPHALAIRLRLNGRTMQDSSTSELIFRIPRLIAHISSTITLEPGDVIATGTPAGVGFARKPQVFLQPGDRIEVEIEGLGVLANSIAAPSA